MSVALTTPFRAISEVSLETWRTEFRNRQSPVSQDDVDLCFAACQGWAVLLDQAIGETSLKDADAIRDKNLLRLTMPDGSSFKQYSAYWKPFAEAVRRLYDAAYKGGVYYPSVAQPLVTEGGGRIGGYNLSLAGYKVVYIGGPRCLSTGGRECANGETYNPNKPMQGLSVVDDPTAPSINRSIAASMIRFDRWFGASSTPTTPAPQPGNLVFGRVPRPAMVDRIIPDNRNRAWNHLGDRRIKGVVLHRQQGNNWGTDSYFRSVPPGGVNACPPPGAQWTYGGCNGLTDFGVDSGSGETLLWNPPDGTARGGASADRAPWASGPWNHIAGDGAAFVARFGVDAINRDLPAIEVDDFYGDAVSDGARQQIARVIAYFADQEKVPHMNFPINPHTGLTFIYWHNEFCGVGFKECPGDVVMRATPDLIARAKAVMKQYQEG